MQKENIEIEYSFIKFPRALVDSEQFRHISIEARTLLAMILDRHYLSEINAERFTDENGKIFNYYTVDEVCKKLSCCKTKCVRIFKELEEKNMIIRNRKNRLSPYRIYLTEKFYDLIKSDFAGSEYRTSRSLNNKTHEVSITEHINNNKSNNNFINNKPSIIGFGRTENEIREQIEYDCIVSDSNRKLLDEIIMIISDVMNGTSLTVRIGRDEMPRGVVIARFCKLDSDHIISVLWQMSRNTAKIRNIKSYLITMLYNAPATDECGITAEFAYHHSNNTGAV